MTTRSSEAEWGLYIPPNTTEPLPNALWPYARIDIPDGSRPLLVVVSSGASLQAARQVNIQYPELPVVVWAWHLAEVLAASAEDTMPVVYGWPSHAQVLEAVARGPERIATTTVLLECESAFDFPIDFDFYEASAQP